MRVTTPKILDAPNLPKTKARGTKVIIQFWPIHYDAFKAETARCAITGWAYNLSDQKQVNFHTGGQLLSVLEEWRAAEYRKHKKKNGYKKRLAA